MVDSIDTEAVLNYTALHASAGLAGDCKEQVGPFYTL